MSGIQSLIEKLLHAGTYKRGSLLLDICISPIHLALDIKTLKT